MRIVGLDLGASHIEVCELKDGQVHRSSVRRLGELKRVLGPGTEPAQVAFEACREGWKVYDTLVEWGHEAVMLDTTRVKQIGIGHHRRKNDAIDAEVIARALESGRYPKAHVLSPARRELRGRLHVRAALVETRAKYIVMIRGIARAIGITIGSGHGHPESFLEKVDEAGLPDDLKHEISPLLEILRVVQKQIEAKEADLIEVANRDATLRLLATAPGVGLIVAATFASVIDDAHRFRNAQAVGSYLGLAPSEDTTGGPNKRRIGGISKHGNSMCRAMLVEAAWQIMRSRNKEDPLCTWAMHIKEKRSGKVAAVALARKLALVLYAMWRDDTVYDGAKEARARVRGIRRDTQNALQRATALERAVAKFERRRKKTRPAKTTETTP